MGQSSEREPAEFMSTHPANDTRIENLINEWQKTLAFYNQAQVDGRTPDCGSNPRAATEVKPKEAKE
jgi:predicted Zn-dependent protease